MARRIADPVTRFLNEYSALSNSERTSVAAAIRGYEYGTTGGLTKAAAAKPRAVVRQQQTSAVQSLNNSPE